MSQQSGGKTQTFRDVALDALRVENSDGVERSRFAQNERFCLFADADGVEKGVEFLLAFPDASESDPSSLLDAQILLSSDGRPILDGIWRVELTVDGRRLEPRSAWETTCVDPSKAYAFCERSIALEGGRRLTRRVFLAYNESLLLLADELVPAPRERVAPAPRICQTTLSLAVETFAKNDAEAREIVLATNVFEPAKPAAPSKARTKPRSEEEALLAEIDGADSPQGREIVLARAFPLALPEWRADASQGEFDANASQAGLELTAQSSGASLFSPLLFDFNVRRAARPCSWRPITVGENTAPAKDDDAWGRRLQLGNEQYVFYASTSARPAIRSILGRNLISDFMVGKFLASRGVVPILDVEVDDE